MGMSLSSSTAGSVAGTSERERSCSYQRKCVCGNANCPWIETLFNPLVVDNTPPPNQAIPTCSSTSIYSPSTMTDRLTSEFHCNFCDIVTVSGAPQRYKYASSPQKRQDYINVTFHNGNRPSHYGKLRINLNDVNVIKKYTADCVRCHEPGRTKMTQPIAIPEQYHREEENCRNENMYDQKTWNMYERIMNSRTTSPAA
mmetsp:Transcript_54378/g.80679  ORF Transcript_54378/g.80679 Transcript_54378/m.80679 type:complete len:199 (-) Transcript_54378:63-659(-)